MNDHMIQLLTTGLSAIAGILAFLKARQVGEKVQQISINIDGKMAEWVAINRAEARATALKEGADEATAAAEVKAADLARVVSSAAQDAATPAQAAAAAAAAAANVVIPAQVQEAQNLTAKLLTAQVENASVQSDQPIQVIGENVQVTEKPQDQSDPKE